MANFKKMDDHDFVFVNKPLTEKEEKEFSNFLKTRKSKKPKESLRIAARKKKVNSLIYSDWPLLHHSQAANPGLAKARFMLRPKCFASLNLMG